MVSFAYLCLLASFWTVTSSEEINGLDSMVFQKVQKDRNVARSKEKVFINNLWLELAKFFPESAKIPGIELNFNKFEEAKPDNAGKYWSDNYMCSVESKIYPKLPSEVPSIVVKKASPRVVVEVEAKIVLDDKTSDFSLYKKFGGTDDVLGPVNVKLSYKGKNKLKFIFDIPDLSTKFSDAKCLINIRSVDVIELGKPTIVEPDSNSKSDQEIVEGFWDVVDTQKPLPFIMRYMMTVALSREINRKLSEKEDYWICLTEEFTKKVKEMEADYKYKEMYEVFCKNEKIED